MSLPIITGKPSQTEVSAGFKYPAVLLSNSEQRKTTLAARGTGKGRKIYPRENLLKTSGPFFFAVRVAKTNRCSFSEPEFV